MPRNTVASRKLYEPRCELQPFSQRPVPPEGHDARSHPETRTEASEALRGLIDAIVLTPNVGEPPSRAGEHSHSGEPRLQIELKGKLAAIWKPPEKRRGRRKPTASSLQIDMVAGARNPLNVEFVWTAA
jgi:hypothetical protein